MLHFKNTRLTTTFMPKTCIFIGPHKLTNNQWLNWQWCHKKLQRPLQKKKLTHHQYLERLSQHIAFDTFANRFWDDGDLSHVEMRPKTNSNGPRDTPKRNHSLRNTALKEFPSSVGGNSLNYQTIKLNSENKQNQNLRSGCPWSRCCWLAWDWAAEREDYWGQVERDKRAASVASECKTTEWFQPDWRIISLQM